jgi:hypothetical protein
MTTPKAFTEDQVRKAVESAADGMNVHPPTLADAVMKRLTEGDALVYHGWRCERVRGKDIPGFKGRGTKYRGWKLTDADGTVGYVYPEHTSDAAEWAVETYAKSLREFKNLGIDPPGGWG